MWTMKYKNGWIHRYCDRNACRIQVGGLTRYVKSLRAAKCLITRLAT